jgi:hypothetical protein
MDLMEWDTESKARYEDHFAQVGDGKARYWL